MTPQRIYDAVFHKEVNGERQQPKGDYTTSGDGCGEHSKSLGVLTVAELRPRWSELLDRSRDYNDVSYCPTSLCA
jgi:hypothetical protein